MVKIKISDDETIDIRWIDCMKIYLAGSMTFFVLLFGILFVVGILISLIP